MKQHNDTARVIQIERLTAAMRPHTQGGASDGSAARIAVPVARRARRQTPSFVEGAGRLDSSGRVKDLAVFEELGWTSGAVCYLTLRLDGERIVARRSTRSTRHRLDAKGRVTLPKGYRSHLGLREGSLLVMAANKRTGELVLMRSDVISKAVA